MPMAVSERADMKSNMPVCKRVCTYVCIRGEKKRVLTITQHMIKTGGSGKAWEGGGRKGRGMSRKPKRLSYDLTNSNVEHYESIVKEGTRQPSRLTRLTSSTVSKIACGVHSATAMVYRKRFFSLFGYLRQYVECHSTRQKFDYLTSRLLWRYCLPFFVLSRITERGP
jgi:hypothetical protein